MSRSIAIAALSVTLSSGCFSCGQKTEEERLAALLEGATVRIYAQIRTTLASSAADERSRAARDAIAAVVMPPAQQTDPERAAATRRMLGALGALGGVRADANAPLVPAVVGLFDPAARSSAPALGIDEDRALVGAAWWLLRAHPDLPSVEEAGLFSLWEVHGISRAGLDRSPLRVLARFVRASQLAQHELCGLASTEATSLRSVATAAAAQEAFVALGIADASVEDRRKVALALRALGSAQAAECFVRLRQAGAAAPHLEAVRADAAALGIEAGDVSRVALELVERTRVGERLARTPAAQGLSRFTQSLSRAASDLDPGQWLTRSR